MLKSRHTLLRHTVKSRLWHILYTIMTLPPIARFCPWTLIIENLQSELVKSEQRLSKIGKSAQMDTAPYHKLTNRQQHISDSTLVIRQQSQLTSQTESSKPSDSSAHCLDILLCIPMVWQCELSPENSLKNWNWWSVYTPRKCEKCIIHVLRLSGKIEQATKLI